MFSFIPLLSQDVYDQSLVSFLLDEDDSIRAYEDRGKAKVNGTQYESGMQLLSNMDRVQQVEVLTGKCCVEQWTECIIYLDMNCCSLSSVIFNTTYNLFRVCNVKC